MMVQLLHIPINKLKYVFTRLTRKEENGNAGNNGDRKFNRICGKILAIKHELCLINRWRQGFTLILIIKVHTTFTDIPILNHF